MTYALGLDIGTTYVAAAVVRDGVVEALSLDNYRVSVPSAVFASGDEMLYGEAALRRGAVHPTGLAREFKRRVGDTVPIVLDGSPYHADRLSALLTKWVADVVADQMGGPPTNIVVTHPANWTDFQLNLFSNALRDVGLGDTSFLSEPAAAALDFAAVSDISEGEMVLVYDLGGGTFDVALLRYAGGGFDHAIEPFGIERLGGVDFDQALFEHVLGELPADVLAEARQSSEAGSALLQLRRAVVDAKETLSADVAADIPIVLPGFTSSIRVTRHDFEQMIEPMVRQTIDGIHLTLSRAEIEPGSLSAVLLVGGSSRIPFIPDLVSKELRLSVRIDAHPKLVVAKGAARQAATLAATKHTSAPNGRSGARRWWPWAAGAVAVGAVVTVGVVVTQSGDSPSPEDGGSTATNVAPLTTEADDSAPTSAVDDDPDSSAVAGDEPLATDPPSATTETTEATDLFEVRTEISTNGLPIGMAVVDGELFVASYMSNQLQRFALDVDPPSPGTPIELPDRNEFRIRGQDIAPTSSGLYVTLRDELAIAVVDTETGVVDKIELGFKPGELAVADDGTVWVSGIRQDDELGYLAPVVDGVLGDLVEFEENVGEVTIDGSMLYFVFYNDRKLGRIDLESDEQTIVDIEGQPNDIEVVNGQLWITLRDTNQVGVLDATSMTMIDRIDVGRNPHKLTEGFGYVWVTNETLPTVGPDKAPGSVSRIDPTTRTVVQDPIEVGLAPVRIVAGADGLFVTNHHGSFDTDLPVEAYETQPDAEQQDINEEFSQPGSVSVIAPSG